MTCSLYIYYYKNVFAIKIVVSLKISDTSCYKFSIACRKIINIKHVLFPYTINVQKADFPKWQVKYISYKEDHNKMVPYNNGFFSFYARFRLERDPYHLF